jgi:hypothetical protein
MGQIDPKHAFKMGPMTGRNRLESGRSAPPRCGKSRTFPFAGKSNSLGAKRESAKASAMSSTRKAPTAANKQSKSRRQDLAAVLVEREAELAEVRRQQAATAEILKVIAASPADVQPVFQAIAARANRLRVFNSGVPHIRRCRSSGGVHLSERESGRGTQGDVPVAARPISGA